MNDPQHHNQSRSINELIRQSQLGDLTAFRSLVDSHQKYLYALAFRILRREDDANDIVQESFIRIWKNLSRYRPGVKFTTWIYSITVHLCYDRIKMDARRHMTISSFDENDGENRRDPTADPQSVLEGRDLCDRILSAAVKLPPMERLVFHLRDIQDFTIEEISELAGMSAASVRTNLCYARKRLRAMVHQLQRDGI
jgi:RNA polymerase sigma-70 factor (ECF subfamily)